MEKEIRLLPINPDEGFPGMSILEVQQELISNKFVRNNCLEYHYRSRSIATDNGSLILFQMDGKIIASGILKDKSEEVMPEFKGKYIFEEGSIKIFEPITATEIKRIDSSFKKFSQSPQKIDYDLIDQVINLIDSKAYKSSRIAEISQIEELEIGNILSNEDIQRIFKCGNMGGMRRSKATNSLVIISDHTKSIYDDKWNGDVLHYTGMGKKGDQDKNFSQNRTLNESKTNGVKVVLFEVVVPKEYVYLGEIELVEEPYKEKQLDEDNLERFVWIFPVKPISNFIENISASIKEMRENIQSKKAKRLSLNELKGRAEASGRGSVSVRNSVTRVYERNQYVVEYAKRRANGICELCNQEAPFNNADGDPYLETHHIVWLSNGGEDTIENTVALCPNCHRKMHILKDSSDVSKLKLIKK